MLIEKLGSVNPSEWKNLALYGWPLLEDLNGFICLTVFEALQTIPLYERENRVQITLSKLKEAKHRREITEGNLALQLYR